MSVLFCTCGAGPHHQCAHPVHFLLKVFAQIIGWRDMRTDDDVWWNANEKYCTVAPVCAHSAENVCFSLVFVCVWFMWVTAEYWWKLKFIGAPINNCCSGKVTICSRDIVIVRRLIYNHLHSRNENSSCTDFTIRDVYTFIFTPENCGSAYCKWTK